MKKYLVCLFLSLAFIGCDSGAHLLNKEVEGKMTVVITRSVSLHYDPAIVITAADIYYNGNDVVVEGLKSIKTFDSGGYYIVPNMAVIGEKILIPIPKNPQYEVEITINIQ